MGLELLRRSATLPSEASMLLELLLYDLSYLVLFVLSMWANWLFVLGCIFMRHLIIFKGRDREGSPFEGVHQHIIQILMGFQQGAKVFDVHIRTDRDGNPFIVALGLNGEMLKRSYFTRFCNHAADLTSVP
jgi:hypothetical protein